MLIGLRSFANTDGAPCVLYSLSLLIESQVQEFMEEIGQGGNPFFESALFKTAEIQFQDMVDNVILGNKLSRQIAGLQPSFPVLVDSFEKR